MGWSDVSVDDQDLWSAYEWPERCLRANFVMSVDGHIEGSDGLSGTLSNSEDRRIFHMQRAGCDAILVGAGTVRLEHYRSINLKPEWQQFRGDRPDPTLIIASRSGQVPDIPGAVVVDGSDFPALKQEYPRILCEGGPHLFATLLREGLVDELALTIGTEIGGAGELVPAPVRKGAQAKHVHMQDGSLFTLWTVS